MKQNEHSFMEHRSYFLGYGVRCVRYMQQQNKYCWRNKDILLYSHYCTCLSERPARSTDYSESGPLLAPKQILNHPGLYVLCKILLVPLDTCYSLTTCSIMVMHLKNRLGQHVRCRRKKIGGNMARKGQRHNFSDDTNSLPQLLVQVIIFMWINNANL